MSDEHVPPPPPPDTPDPISAPPPPPPAPPPPTSGGVSENRTIFLVLSYLGILALIPFLMEKEDKEVQWHAKHGLVLFGAWIVLWIGLAIVQAVVTGIMGDPGCFSCALYPLISLVILVIHIICIVKALKGERFKLPVISDFVEKF